MTPLFKKLNFKMQKQICILNSPAEFEKEAEEIKKVTSLITNMRDCKKVEFILSFVKTKKEIETISSGLAKKIEGDAIVWFAYPKKTSKKYNVEINRDYGWDVLRNGGLDTVRAVSIDDDWSALRFRKVAFIEK